MYDYICIDDIGYIIYDLCNRECQHFIFPSSAIPVRVNARVFAPAGPYFSSSLTSAASGRGEGESGQGGRRRWMRWFGIPASLGIACLAVLQLTRTVRRERKTNW